MPLTPLSVLRTWLQAIVSASVRLCGFKTAVRSTPVSDQNGSFCIVPPLLSVSLSTQTERRSECVEEMALERA